MMIKNYVILDDTGVYPIRAGANFSIPSGAVEVPWEVLEYEKYMLVKDEWHARPAILEPTITADGVVTFTSLPKEAVAVITDQETHAVLAEVPVTDDHIEFQLVEPAVYRVVVKMPLPWLNWEGVIKC